jgi:hypothetical protein
MTKQHKATPEQWAFAEACAPEDFAGYACILELRARIEALEAAQQPLVNYAPVKPECRDKLDRLIEQDRSNPHQPEPVAPTDEELYELWNSEGIEADFQDCRRFARAYAARWGTPAIQPVPVSERLPEPSVKVLAHYLNALGKGRTICAIWVPAKSRSDEGDLDADDFLEYDEESDKYHWPEGWYEAIENWEELGWAKVYEGEIAYWQPLPQWPAHALPIPEATNA